MCANPTGAEGLLIYNSTSKVVQYCDGTNWIGMGGGGSGGGSSTIVGLSDVDAASAGNGNILQYNSTSTKWEAVPLPAGVAGTDTQVQFNDGGSTLAGAAQLLWDKTNNYLTVGTTTPGSYTLDVTGKSATSSLILKSVSGAGAPGGGGAASGTDGQVQFNVSGALSGDSNFVWDNTNKRLGIGTATPANSLHVSDATTRPATFTSSNTDYMMVTLRDTALTAANGGQWAIGINGSSPTTLSTYPAGALLIHQDSVGPRMVITKDGKVGIGATSPVTNLDVRGGVSFQSTLGNATLNNYDNDVTTSFNISGSSGSTTRLLAIHASASGTQGSAVSGQIFSVYGHNGSAYVPTLHALNTGRVGVGMTAPNATLQVGGDAIFGSGTSAASFATGGVGITGSSAGRIYISRTNADTVMEFGWQPTATRVGSISINSSATSFNTSSDRRLKENIVDTGAGLDTLMKIQVQDFNFINDTDKKRVQGFIAQQLNAVYPEAVTTNGDDGEGPLKEDGKGWQVDYGRLTPLLVRAVQELKAENDALKSQNAAILERLDALEAKE